MNFEPFEEAVRNPRKQLDKYLNQNKKVIGCFPLYVPEQLVYAAGMIPFGMWGSNIEVKLAKNYFPAYVCGILQTNFELAMKGVYDGISAVMITTLCDSLKCATQNWKYAVPGIEMIPVVHPQNRLSKGAYPFLLAQYQKIIKRLEEISGNKIQNENLHRAIEIYNEHNQVMRDFLKMLSNYPKEITPQYRNYVIKSGHFMDKKEHTQLVQNLMDELQGKVPQVFRGIKVVTTGIIADSEDLLNIFAENKVAIVADDIAHESRQFRVDVQSKENLLRALVEQYLGMYGCSAVIGGNITRKEQILKLVKDNTADGVIMLMTKFCDPEEYDYPLIKKVLDENRIPLLTIEVDKQIRNYGQAATAVQSFQEMIRL